MAEPESKLRSAVIIYFPMFIAALSLITSMYNGYLNNRFVELMQANIGRVEYLRTCRDIIDAYFQVKFLTEQIGVEPQSSPGGERVDAMSAVNKFAALGTYLANLRDEDIRREYTQLTHELEAAVSRAAPSGNRQKLFEASDAMFARLNDDCIRSAQAAPM
jgi:hypothetical protein